MSSKANKIEKRARKIDELYNTTIGTIILTVGINAGKTESECRKMYRELKKNQKVLPTTIEKITDYVWTVFGNEDYDRRASFVLLTDNKNVRTPLVTFVNPDGNIMPLNPKGFKDVNLITLAAEGRDWIDCEFIFDDNGDIIKEENN